MMDLVKKAVTLKSAPTQSCSVEIATEFTPFLERALIRVGYLFPHSKIVHEGSNIVIETEPPLDVSLISRELRYQLYREKIFADTLDLRRDLIKALTE